MNKQTDIRILIAGDFCPINRVEKLIGTAKAEDILKEVSSIAQNCDLSIVNLECPLLFKEAKPIVKCGPNLKATYMAAQVLKESGFSLVTLANNHILDYGKEGLNQTLSTLDKLGICHVGVGNNIHEANKTYYYKKNGKIIAIINCCEHEFSIATESNAGANPLNPIKQWYAINEAKQHADYVIVIVHGGHELYQLPSPRMQETYRFFVDSGAYAVINHHQHCYSGYEIYNGRPIFYGLGNFCFDKDNKRNSIWNRGYMVELIIGDQVEFQLHAYDQCNQTPNIKLLHGQEKINVKNDIQRLNTIISSPPTLKKEHEKWMMQDERSWLTLLTPFSNRYIKTFICRRYFPLLVSKQKIITLLNRVTCEAHRDKLINILEKNI